MRFRGVLAGGAIAVALAACDGSSRPWEVEGSGGPSPRVPAPSASAASADGSAEPGEAAPLAGGVLVRCAEGFRPPADPLVAVTKLAIACGPSAGMTRTGDGPTEGAVAEGSAEVRLPMVLKAGVCYRMFAVGDTGIEDLSVEVRSSRGTLIASDHRADRVAVVLPDRPVCPPAEDEVVVTVAAAKGHGAFALEVWELPAH